MVANEEKEAKGDTEHINIKVLGSDGVVVQFKIKKETPLVKLMRAYCERKNLDVNSVKFTFDGEPVGKTSTPNSLEMEEGDTIEIFAPQTGGR